MTATTTARPQAAAESGLTGEGARRLRHGAWRVVITGAGGWLGMATVELLHRLLGADVHHRVACFGAQARTLRLRDGLVVEQQPLAALADLAPAPSLVLHLAYLTQEKATSMSEAAYVAANRAIADEVLAALDRIGAEGVFLASSGAAYLADRPEAAASMRLYGSLKLEDERRFADWAGRGARRAAIARVFNLAGPYINKTSSYALACFIADALAGRPIEIRADRPVFRSYVAIEELMSVALGVLTDPAAGVTRFDTAGEAVLEMADIAAAAQAQAGSAGGVRRAQLTKAEADRYVGDGEAYRRLRSRYGVQPVSFARQVEETARFMVQGADWRPSRDTP